MFFYIDESGNTGSNLFDKNQPYLYYGILSAETDIDETAEAEVIRARQRKGVERLHASELRLEGLVEISDCLMSIDQKHQLRFDLCRVVKADHAVISFFDQVFDQGMNPAMTWSGYWTPLRYVLLGKVAYLFDDELAERAWKARIDTNNPSAEAELVSVCRELVSRLPALPDARSRQLIGDTLKWAAQNPSALSYNCRSKEDVPGITPNIIGFQAVMHGIASMVEGPESASSIIVDRQTQFNKAQKTLAEFYAKTRHVDWFTGPGLPKMNLSNIPAVPIRFKAGTDSIGLELVDCYLWIFKRLLEDKRLAPELFPLIGSHLDRASFQDLSIQSMLNRWHLFFEELPVPTGEQLKAAEKLQVMEEERRVHMDK